MNTRIAKKGAIIAMFERARSVGTHTDAE